MSSATRKYSACVSPAPSSPSRCSSLRTSGCISCTISGWRKRFQRPCDLAWAISASSAGGGCHLPGPSWDACACSGRRRRRNKRTGVGPQRAIRLCLFACLLVPHLELVLRWNDAVDDEMVHLLHEVVAMVAAQARHWRRWRAQGQQCEAYRHAKAREKVGRREVKA